MTAADIQRVKDLLPTSLGTDEIREQYAREILARSVFSARMESARYLAKVRELCARIVEGSLDQATARAELLKVLETMGHSPQDEGGLKNPASIRRLNLIIDTQRQMAASVANMANETESTLWAYPAHELSRAVGKRVPREDWPRRWKAAGDSVGWQGALPGKRMIALKSSPIWAALGLGVGGFKDTLGNPYPPFAFNSGLSWDDVDRDTCINLGLIKDDEEVSPLKRASLSPAEEEIAEAARRYAFDKLMEGLA